MLTRCKNLEKRMWTVVFVDCELSFDESKQQKQSQEQFSTSMRTDNSVAFKTVQNRFKSVKI